jgi:hypothetical protein
MAKRACFYDPAEYARDVKRVALEHEVREGLWTPLADVDVIVAREFLTPDAQFALALTCKHAHACLPVPLLSHALAYALVKGRGPVFEWLVGTFIAGGEDALSDLDNTYGDLPGRADEATLVALALRTLDGYRARPPYWDGTLYCGRVEFLAVHPVVACASRQAALTGLFTDLARDDVSVASAGNWFAFCTMAGVDVDWIDVFYGILRTGNLDHIAFHYHAIIIPQARSRLDFIFGMFHAAYGGVKALDFFWLDVVRGPDGAHGPGRTQLTEDASTALLARFFRAYWELAPDVQRYFVDRVFAAPRYSTTGHEGLQLRLPPLRTMITMSATDADRRMLVSVLVSATRAPMRLLHVDRVVHEPLETWLSGLFWLLVRTGDARILDIMYNTVPPQILHDHALRLDGALPPQMWASILQRWPYTRQLAGSVAFGSALNILCWAAVVPLEYVDEVLLSRINATLTDLRLHLILNVPVALLNLPLPAAVHRWQSDVMDIRMPLRLLIQRRINYTEHVTDVQKTRIRSILSKRMLRLLADDRK